MEVNVDGAKELTQVIQGSLFSKDEQLSKHTETTPVKIVPVLQQSSPLVQSREDQTEPGPGETQAGIQFLMQRI